MLKRYWRALKADKETRQITWIVIAWIAVSVFIYWLSNHWALLSVFLLALPFLWIAYEIFKAVLVMIASAIKEIFK